MFSRVRSSDSFKLQIMEAWDSDSGSSHASCESTNENEDENKDILVKQLDVSVLLASLLEERCVSLDGDRGQELFADVCAYLSKNKVLRPRNNENEMRKQKEILDKIIQSMAQNAMKEEMPISGQSAVQNTRYTNDFKEIKRLGKGGFGTVYEATHKLDGRKYAVKKIDLKQDADMAKPLREVRALARLKHENIMGYHNAWLEDDSRVSASAGSSYDESEGSSESMSDNVVNICRDKVLQGQLAKKDKQMLCIQTELCNCTLQVWLQERNDKLTNISTDYDTEDLPPDIKHIFNGILSGVEYIHSKGLMHRDLKPQNIFLCGPDHHVKIGDFGLVKGVCGSDSVLSSPTIEGVPFDLKNTRGIGSELYGSPELLRGKTCDTKCDMYSLGVLLFELCNTFTTDMERFKSITELREKNCCPRQLEKMWPERKVQLINDLINPEPDRRPTAKAVLRNSLFATATKQQVQLINDLIHPEPDRRPTAEAVLRNSLFTTATKQQTLWQLNPQAQKPDQKGKKHDQKFKKQDHKLKKQDQTFNEHGQTFNKQGQTFNKQDQTFNKQDQTFIEHGQTFNKQGQTFNKQDQTFKEHGQTFNKQGQTFNKQDQTFIEHGQTFNKQGQTFNKQGQTFNKQNQTFIEHGQTFNKQGQTFNKQDQTFNKQDQTFIEHGQTFNKQGQTFNKHDQTFNKQGQTFNKQDQTFIEHGQTFNKQGQTFNKQGQTFNKQDQTFIEHGQTFNKQGQTFNEQGQTFNEQGVNPKEQDQENAVESSREASSGAQFMGYVRKTKK